MRLVSSLILSLPASLIFLTATKLRWFFFFFLHFLRMGNNLPNRKNVARERDRDNLKFCLCVTISAWILLQYSRSLSLSFCRQAAIYLTTNIFLATVLKMTSCLARSIHPVIQATIQQCCHFCTQCLSLSPFSSSSSSWSVSPGCSGCKLQQWQASNRLCCYYFRQLSLPDAQYSLPPSRTHSPSHSHSHFCVSHVPWLGCI